jgi:hypothetical protein
LRAPSSRRHSPSRRSCQKVTRRRSSSAQLGASISTASPATLRQRALGVVSHYGCQGGCSGFGGRGDAVELEGVNRFWRELSRRVL